jgi:RimJ/RimL family protein N-acetyltransferase
VFQVFSYHIQAALASERSKTLLAEAEAARRARDARSPRERMGISTAGSSPLRWRAGRLVLRISWPRGPRYVANGKRAVLRDGSEVLIRQVRSADAPLLADGFARLSAASRQMRFLSPKQELSPAELRYFTGMDHHDHEALGAVDHANGRGVGVARYIRRADDPQAADIAITVIDEWQGRGLGTELVAQLSERAREEGIRRFTALVAADNVAVAGLLRRVGADIVRRESATVRYEIPLVPGEGSHFARRPCGSEASRLTV